MADHWSIEGNGTPLHPSLRNKVGLGSVDALAAIREITLGVCSIWIDQMSDLAERLGAKPFKSHQSDSPLDIEIVERRLDARIPSPLREWLLEFGYAITFDKQIGFAPNQFTGLEDDGYLYLDMFYGLAEGSYGIIEINETYDDQFPPGLLVIGDAQGGDQICIQKETGRVLFWHHEALYLETSCYEIARSVEEFFNRLEVLPEKEYDVRAVKVRLDPDLFD